MSPQLSKQKKCKGKCSYEVKVVYGDHWYDMCSTVLVNMRVFIKDRR